ncbi:MAG: hypothetical protein B7X41_11200 [Microbacterium sp. 14-71-5]|jgi:hypothetical protein|uniref:hypothetical protein n=1 Tax=Microbacterium sp. 13-71-7 TaxID=1970399 RepID=UPI000BCB8CEB|nr:hypothetical protein [Microbacterium sp. 13-71-7]OZB83157.1 MAG: hypothetical protein B7X32_11345 [Microbacterium sp. 13-71-7]OZB87858.1 MAG: hypothetical protein B7X41_11200 [Microbacterium sp. 14-71-5]
MQELAGKLTAFDPEASESLKVISYFDALISGGVGVDGLLSGAAVLSGTIAGAEVRGRTTRRDPDGRRVEIAPLAEQHPRRTGDGWSVWLERVGVPFASDEMIVERLALAIDLLSVRWNPDSTLEIAIDETRSADERAAALARLQIDPGMRLRLIATSANDTPVGRPSTIVATKYGLLRATIDVQEDPRLPGRAGIGTWERAENAPASWGGAVVGYRLATDEIPVVDSSILGAMLVLARAYDPAHPHPDVVALRKLDERTTQILLALAEAESIRAVAAHLGMHHSSLQARHEALTRELGYDVRTTVGRIRYGAAELLRRLTV